MAIALTAQFKHRALRLMGIDGRPRLRPSTAGTIFAVELVAILLIASTAWRGMAKAGDEPAKATTTTPQPRETNPPRTNSEVPSKANPNAASKEKETTTPISIFGRAVDSDGKPIAGAIIYVASQEPGYKRLADTTTDDEGRYDFRDLPLPVKESDVERGKSQGAFEVFGQAKGYGFSWCHTKWFYPSDKPKNVVPAREEPRNFDYSDEIHINLTFKPAAKLCGLIVDNLGQPIPNTVVDIRQADGIPVNGYGQEQQFRNLSPGDEFDSLNGRTVVPPEMKLRKTDAAGRFEFDALPPNSRFRIDVRPPGFAQRWIYAVTQKGVKNTDGEEVFTDGMELVFTRTVDVPIQVLFEDSNQPASKVLVSADNRESSDLATTDGAGLAKLRLPPGEYRFHLLPAFGTPYLESTTENAMKVVDKAPADRLVLRLRSAAIVEMTVVDADTGKGVPNVDYWVTDPAKPSSRIDHYFRSWEVATRTAHVERPRTGTDGKLRALFEPGKYQVGVGRDFLPRDYEILEREGQKIECEAGKKLQLKFQLKAIPRPEEGKVQ